MKYSTELSEWCKGEKINNCSYSHLPVEFDGTAVTKSVLELQMLQKGMDSDLETEIFSLPFKKKGNGKLKNGVKRAVTDESSSPVKKKVKDGSLQKANSVKLPKNKPVPVKNALSKKMLINNTVVKDPKLIDGLTEQNVDSEETLEESSKTYVCKYCCKRFTHPQSLKVHLLTHQDNPIHKCHLCGLTVSTFSSLMSHYVKHSGIKLFGASEYAVKKGTPLSAIKTETTKKSQSKNKTGILCTKCKKTFTSQMMFVSHFCPPMSKKTEYVCTYCRKVTTTVEEYRDHIQSHSTAHFLCGHCSVRFESKTSLKEHFLTCKKRPKSAIMPLTPKKIISSAKQSSLTGLKFRKLKPKLEVLPAANIKLENEVPLPADSIQSTSTEEEQEKQSMKSFKPRAMSDVVIKEEPLSPIPSEDDDVCLDTFAMNGNESRTVRSRRRARKINVTEEQSDLPTRRSARLVNRKPVKFSPISSDSEYDERNEILETLMKSPKRQRSPVKLEEMPLNLEVPKAQRKTKSPNAKSPKKQKKSESKIFVLDENQEEVKHHEPLTPSKESDAEQDSIKTLSDEVSRIQETIAKECKELVSESTVMPESTKKEVVVQISPKARKTPKTLVKSPKPKKIKNLKKERLKVAEIESQNIDIDLQNIEIESQNIEMKQTTLVCNQCSLVFRCKGSLKRHRKMHSGKPQFACTYCGKFFFRKDIHKRHEMNVHLNEEDKRFICYYCKESFAESAALKEHSYTVHSAKAMAPERIRRCTSNSIAAIKRKIKTEMLKSTEKVLVKDEHIENSKLQEQKDPPDSKDNLYNCKECNLTFENPSILVKHFNEVHSTAGDLRIIKVEKGDDYDGDITIKKENNSETIIIKKALKSTPSVNIPKKSWSSPKKCSVSSTTSVTKLSKARKKIDSDAAMKPTEVPEEVECIVNIKQATNEKCDLYCAITTEAESHPCENDAFHKAVEWYQCQICTVSGPVAKMKDHMFKHMTRLGIFIVNCENKDFDSLIQTPLIEENGDVMVDSQEYCDNEEHPALPTASSDDIDDMPIPSIINSVCTLMSEVKCARCDEEIIDFDVLSSHPCLEKDGSFSCFVQNCQHGSLCDREDALNHFRTSHYESLYSDPRTKSEPDTDDNSDIESYSMHLGSPGRDTIFTETSTELLKCK